MQAVDADDNSEASKKARLTPIPGEPASAVDPNARTSDSEGQTSTAPDTSPNDEPSEDRSSQTLKLITESDYRARVAEVLFPPVHTADLCTNMS